MAKEPSTNPTYKRTESDKTALRKAKQQLIIDLNNRLRAVEQGVNKGEESKLIAELSSTTVVRRQLSSLLLKSLQDGSNIAPESLKESSEMIAKYRNLQSNLSVIHNLARILKDKDPKAKSSFEEINNLTEKQIVNYFKHPASHKNLFTNTQTFLDAIKLSVNIHITTKSDLNYNTRKILSYIQDTLGNYTEFQNLSLAIFNSQITDNLKDPKIAQQINKFKKTLEKAATNHVHKNTVQEQIKANALVMYLDNNNFSKDELEEKILAFEKNPEYSYVLDAQHQIKSAFLEESLTLKAIEYFIDDNPDVILGKQKDSNLEQLRQKLFKSLGAGSGWSDQSRKAAWILTKEAAILGATGGIIGGLSRGFKIYSTWRKYRKLRKLQKGVTSYKEYLRLQQAGTAASAINQAGRLKRGSMFIGGFAKEVFLFHNIHANLHDYAFDVADFSIERAYEHLTHLDGYIQTAKMLAAFGIVGGISRSIGRATVLKFKLAPKAILSCIEHPAMAAQAGVLMKLFLESCALAPVAGFMFGLELQQESERLQNAINNLEGEDDQENLDQINYSLLSIRSILITASIAVGGKIGHGKTKLSKEQLRDLSKAEAHRDFALLHGRKPVEFNDAVVRTKDIKNAVEQGEVNPLESLLIEDVLKMDLSKAKTSELKTLQQIESTSKAGQKLQDKIDAELQSREATIKESQKQTEAETSRLEAETKAAESEISNKQQSTEIESHQAQSRQIELDHTRSELEIDAISRDQGQIITKSVQHLKTEIQTQKNQSTPDQARINELETSQNKLEQKHQESETANEQTNQEIESLQESIQDNQVELETAIESNQAGEILRLKQEIENAQNQIQEVLENNTVTQSKLNQEIQNLLNEQINLSQSNTTLKSQLQSAQKNIQAQNKTIQQQKANLRTNKAEATKLRQEHAREIQSLKELNSRQLDLLKQQHQRKIQDLKAKQESAIEQANQETQNAKEALENALNELETARAEAAEILKTKNGSQAELAEARRQAAEIIRQSEIKAQEIIESQKAQEQAAKEALKSAQRAEQEITTEAQNKAEKIQRQALEKARKIKEKAELDSQSKSKIEQQRIKEKAEAEALKIKQKAEHDITKVRERAEAEIKEIRENANKEHAKALEARRQAQKELKRAEEKADSVIENAKTQGKQIIEAAKTKAKTETRAEAKQTRDKARAEARRIKEQAKAEAKRIKEQAKAEAKRIKEQAKRELEAEQAKAEAKRNKAERKAEKKSEKVSKKAVKRLSKQRVKNQRSQQRLDQFRKEASKRSRSNRITHNTQELLDDILDNLKQLLVPSGNPLSLDFRLNNLVVSRSMFDKHIDSKGDFKINSKSTPKDANDMLVIANFFGGMEDLIKAAANSNPAFQQQIAIGLYLSQEKHPHNFKFDLKPFQNNSKYSDTLKQVIQSIVKIKELQATLSKNEFKLPIGGLENPDNQQFFQALNKSLYTLPKERINQLFEKLLPEIETEGTLHSLIENINEQTVTVLLSQLTAVDNFAVRFLRNLVRAYQIKNNIKQPLITDYDFRAITDSKAQVALINLNSKNLDQISEKLNQIELLNSIRNNLAIVKSIKAPDKNASELYNQLYKILNVSEDSKKIQAIDKLILYKQANLKLKASNVSEIDITTQEKLVQATKEVIETLQKPDLDLKTYLQQKNGDTQQIIRENLRFINNENLEKYITNTSNKNNKLSLIQNFCIQSLSNPKPELNLQLAAEFENRIMLRSIKDQKNIDFEKLESCDLPNGKTLTETLVAKQLVTPEILAKLLFTQPQTLISIYKSKQKYLDPILAKLKPHHLPYSNLKSLIANPSYSKVYKDHPLLNTIKQFK